MKNKLQEVDNKLVDLIEKVSNGVIGKGATIDSLREVELHVKKLITGMKVFAFCDYDQGETYWIAGPTVDEIYAFAHKELDFAADMHAYEIEEEHWDDLTVLDTESDPEENKRISFREIIDGIYETDFVASTVD